MKSRGAVIVIAGTLLVLPTSAVAKPGFFVQKPVVSIEFGMQASNGYRVSVSAASGGRSRLGRVEISATRRHNQDVVMYLARGRGEKDGAVNAKLPGVGRIAVKFRTTRVTPKATAGNCKGRPAIVRHGVFRGVIELHGEQGYTTVDSNIAKGTVTHAFRQVCNNGKPPGHGDPGGFPVQVSLFTGTREGSPSLSFTASLVNFGPELGGSVVSFTASSARRRDGLFVSHSVTAEGKPAEFSLSEPAVSPENATVEPPPPFRGSAAFHLTSPTSSSWEGDLKTELPGVGKVALAGPNYWSVLCSETCTKTLPPNVEIFSGVF